VKILKNKRILICGKGGSGKSSIVSLLGDELIKHKYKVILLDADASNPGGLFRLLTDGNKPPKPLIEFFGGREKVTCPSDDPSTLTRIGNKLPITESAIKLSEVPKKYSVKKKNLTLFQIGKIKEACEGCDGPMSKVARDFIVKDGFVTLIDIEAGIEHFGRGVEKNVDVILIVVDPTFESFVIAEIVTKMSLYLGNKNVFAIINKVDSKETGLIMQNSLRKRGVNYLGSISYDKKIYKAGLEGKRITQCKSQKQIADIVKKLENIMTIKKEIS
jgi:CO dehydrogenase maturation factor